MIHRALGAALLMLLAATSPALAADEALVLRQRAEQLAAQDRCDEALPRAQRARELDPGDARAALVEGRCLLRVGLYSDAIPVLERARELDPSLPGVSTDLAQCHYHLEQLPPARQALERAAQQDPDDARMHLYRGLVLLREAKRAEAAEAFDRAGRLDASLAEVASLYAGRTWASVRDRERAAAALQRARRAEPGSEWATEAERELERLNAPYERHAWAKLRGGVEYDDNVALRVPGSANALNVQAFGAFEFDERSDVRAVYEAEVGGEFLRNPDNSAGVMAGFDGTSHLKRFHEFDLQYPWLSLWYDRRVGEDTWLRLQPFGGYAWLETDPFVIHGGALLALSHAFSERVDGQLFARANVNDYLFRIRPDPILSSALFSTVPGIAADARRRRNRDGVQVDVGSEVGFELASLGTRLRLGGNYERYEAEGRDWGRHGGRGSASLHQPLPWRFHADLRADFTYHDYDHRSSFLPANQFAFDDGSKRRDRIWDLVGEIGFAVTEWLELSGRYRYLDQDSNTNVFDYDRHIVGGYLTLFWGD